MSWPDPEPGMPADDYTREHRALYARIRAEASRLPADEPDPVIYQDGPTASWALYEQEGHAWRAVLEHLAAAPPRDDTPDVGELEPDAA